MFAALAMRQAGTPSTIWRCALPTTGMGNSAAQALEAFQSRTGESDRFTIEEGDDIRLRPKVALALGMAFHELATNAAKYGALSNGAGRVTLSWQLEPKADRLRVRWQESGGPPVKPPTRKGFGSRLIERGLAQELGGQVDLNYYPAGVSCVIDMPAPEDQ